MPLEPGTRLGSYQITSLLGSGGMGDVYRAKDLKLGRDVAVKVIREEVASEPDRLRRFEQEARSASALNHPNIITIHDIRLRHLSPGAGLGGEEGLDYIVMEYVEGRTLREVLGEGRVPARKLVPLAAQIAEGLAKAHSAGIVHRDLKPENLMVTRDGYVKILDFGLAKLRPESGGIDSELLTLTKRETEPGVVMGTVGYMSPEQAAGRRVDYRTDQFAFGCILYEMLTGRKAFRGDTGPEILAAVLRDEPQPIDSATGEAPPQLLSIVERCLSKDPDERYDSTRDLAKELRRLREIPSTPTLAPTPSEDVFPGPPRRRWAAAVAAAGVAVGVITASVFWLIRGTEGERSSPLRIQRFHMNLGGLAIPPPASGMAAMALSADGKQVAFRGFLETGQSALYLRRLDQFEVTPIPGTEGASCPFFSPDGSWLGFEQGGELKKIFLEDGTTGTLCDAPQMRGASWGEDGTILFSARGKGLFRVSESGGPPEVVTEPDPNRQEWMHKFPQILPGTRAAMFTIQTLGFDSRTVGIVDMDTGVQRVLLQDACHPRYVATGHILFTRNGTLMAAAFDVDGLELTGPPVPLLTGVGYDGSTGLASYEPSMAGPLVFVPWEARPSQRRLVWLDRSGSVQSVVGDPRPFDNLAISPDGRRLAFSVDSEDYSLFVMDLASGALSRVAERSMQAVWSPDGRSVFVTRFSAEGKRTTWLERLALDTGGEPETILEGEAQMVAVAPDGKSLLFCHQTASLQWDILRASLEGEKKIEPFLETEASELFPAFSPDGRFVAYVSRETGRAQIFIRPSSGPGPKVPVPLPWSSAPIWRQGGLFAVGPSGKENAMGVFQIDVATEPRLDIGTARLLFVVPKNMRAGAYDASPDGQRFLAIEMEPRELEPPPLAVIPNWLDEMRTRLREEGR